MRTPPPRADATIARSGECCYTGPMDEAFVIGISGGSGSGKTTIVNQIAEVVPDFVVLAQDSYYRDADDIPRRRSHNPAATSPDSGLGTSIDNRNISEYNFDHPEAFDTELIVKHVKGLRRGETALVPVYDFVGHRRMEDTVRLRPKKVVVVEGILIFFDRELRDLIDLKIYVDTPDDIRFIRRLRRDVAERGRTQESVVAQYLDAVRPSHYEYIEPTKAYADLIIPEGGTNRAALEVLASFIRTTVSDEGGVSDNAV